MVFEIWNDLSGPGPMMDDFSLPLLPFDTSFLDVPLDSADGVFCAFAASPATDSLPEVVVTGTRPDPPNFESFWSQHDYTAAFDYTNDWGSAGVDAGEVAAYATVGVSAAANEFADAHVHNVGTTVADAHAYKLAHDAFAKLYDWLKANPNSVIDVGRGQTINATQALSYLDHITFNVGTAVAGTRGAYTDIRFPAGGVTSTVTSLDPDNRTQQTYGTRYGDAGINYNIFHEIGHSLNAFGFGQASALDEAAANTAGRSLELFLGLELMADPPQAGYN